MDDFFSIVSKAVIIIPVVIVIAALILKFNQPIRQTNIRNQVNQPTKNPSPVKKIELDLKGPWICRFKQNQKEYLLSIKKRKIVLEINEAGAIKKIDLSSFSSILENLFNLEYSQFENMIKPYLPEGTSLKKLIDNCKKIQ